MTLLVVEVAAVGQPMALLNQAAAAVAHGRKSLQLRYLMLHRIAKLAVAALAGQLTVVLDLQEHLLMAA
jgi:hypothetical protein